MPPPTSGPGLRGQPSRGGRRGFVYNPDAPKVKAAQLKLFT